MSEIIPAFRKPSTWFGFFGPAKLPPDIVTQLNTEMRKAITAPEARAKLEDEAFNVSASGSSRHLDALDESTPRQCVRSGTFRLRRDH
jgi:tripartite-type tricarboxylate transporter receptor subunit TctC